MSWHPQGTTATIFTCTLPGKTCAPMQRSLRQPVLDQGIQTIAAPRYEDGMRDTLCAQIGDIAAAAEQWIHTLDDEAADRA